MNLTSCRTITFLSIFCLLGQGCGTLWNIPAHQEVRFHGKPQGMHVTIRDAKTEEIYQRLKTPTTLTFHSSPWNMLRKHAYICTFEAPGYLPITTPLKARIPNGMYLLWTVGFPVGLVSACVDDALGSGSYRFQKEVKIRLREEVKADRESDFEP